MSTGLCTLCHVYYIDTYDLVEICVCTSATDWGEIQGVEIAF